MLWWDPVGVYGVPEAIDEYDGYVGQVGRLLREGASHEGLADYFSKHDFGLPRTGPATRLLPSRHWSGSVVRWRGWANSTIRRT
jgi:hypothetical protein